MISLIERSAEFFKLSPLGRSIVLREDLSGPTESQVTPQDAIHAAIDWLCEAQDNSATADGGVARHFSLRSGWGASYPETTGYIIPTFIDYAYSLSLISPDKKNDLVAIRSLLERARRMLDWLVEIQMEKGGFQGGVVNATPKVPVTFNTGQILLGLTAGVRAFGDTYRESMIRAADWLVNTQDEDGCWRSHPTPFAAPGEKAYETHVAWGLLEAARVEPSRGYGEAALKNVRWALEKQRSNGWFDKCCLQDPKAPLTHTIGYALRGVIEAYRFSRDPEFLNSALRTATGILSAIESDGFLPGRLDASWRGAVNWSCLTGSVQIAACYLLLFDITGEEQYPEIAHRLNSYVRRSMRLEAPSTIRGGIAGSFPIWGAYGQYEYLNWAAKFFIDSHLMELRVAADQPVSAEFTPAHL